MPGGRLPGPPGASGYKPPPQDATLAPLADVVIASFFLGCGVPTPGSATGPERRWWRAPDQRVALERLVNALHRRYRKQVASATLIEAVYGARSKHASHS